MNILFLSFEMMIPWLPEPARGANFRGGLGILAGDFIGGFLRLAKIPGNNMRVIACIPLHSRFNGSTILYDSLLPEMFKITSQDRSIVVRKIINKGGVTLVGLDCPPVLDYLYNEDRWHRLEQEILFAKAIPLVLKSMKFKPDIVWFNESHTAPLIPEIKEDCYFMGAKILFTNHTPESAGNEKYDSGWFHRMCLDEGKYRKIFTSNGCIDFTGAAMFLADGVNAVSDEHCQVMQEQYPVHREKIIGIRNGSNRQTWLSPRLKEAGENVDLAKLGAIHQLDKSDFRNFLGLQFDLKKPWLGFFRRVVEYKNQYPMLAPIIRAICGKRGELVDTAFGKLEGLGIQVVCAGYAADSKSRIWIDEFKGWMRDPLLKNDFIFFDRYDFDLLAGFARGLDIGLHCPIIGREACGTSTQRSMINGNPIITARTGGDMEFIEEFNPETGQGNGFYLDPYGPLTVYEKAKIASGLYYGCLERGDTSWLKLTWNAFETGKNLDITDVIARYRQRVFEPLRVAAAV
jgi:glucan phosphorylase